MVQRIYALHYGLEAKYRIWWYGVLVAVLITFLTKGYIVLAIPGGMVFVIIAGYRLGEFRYGLNYFALGTIAMMGPIANMLLALFFKFMLYFSPANPLIQKAMMMRPIGKQSNLLVNWRLVIRK